MINELVECLELYKSGDEERLHQRITEEAYYRNFVGLAQNIGPDGRNVELVGFTAVRSGAPKQVQLTYSPPAVPPVKDYAQQRPPRDEKPDENAVEFTGTLKFANSLKKTNEIQIVSTGNIRHAVVVPTGMMSDIVKPLWEEEVTVTGTQRGKRIYLTQIRPVEPD